MVYAGNSLLGIELGEIPLVFRSQNGILIVLFQQIVWLKHLKLRVDFQ